MRSRKRWSKYVAPMLARHPVFAAAEVRDTGRGIPPDKLDFIFEEFGRIGDSDQTGAGLGLAISRLLAQALGGQVTVVSRMGRGSTFSLWLPVAAQLGDQNADFDTARENTSKFVPATPRRSARPARERGRSAS